MLLHFKLNCFIFVMLVGQINLGEKVSGNIDAFFDTSVDDLQDNFYDIPFIPENAENNQNYDELSEHDIFHFGRENLIENLNEDINTDLAEIHRLSAIKNAIVKREIAPENEISKRNDDCFQSQTLNDNSSSDGLLDSVVEKFNQIGKEKNNLHMRMQNIEDDEAVLEKGRTFNLRLVRKQINPEKLKILNVHHRAKRNVFEDLPLKNRKRRHKYINSLHFSHKYRHNNPTNSDCNKGVAEAMNYAEAEAEEAPQIGKRMCSKRPKIPHKHKSASAPFHSSKHEAFKEDLLENEECSVKTNVDESGCNTTKHEEEHTTEATTTKKKHKQLAAKAKQKSPTLKAKQNNETCDKTKPSKEPVKKTELTKHQLNPLKKLKSLIPPTKPSIKSVLCHKNPTTTATTTTTTTTAKTTSSEFEEYEDYKAGDYIETQKKREDHVEFREKRDKTQRSNCEHKENKPNSGGNKNAIDDFLREETTEDNSESGHQYHQSPILGTKNHKEDAIDQFLKEETTKLDYVVKGTEPENNYKRNKYQVEEMDENVQTGNSDEASHVKANENEDASNDKKNTPNNLDSFINEEVPKTEIFQFPSNCENGGAPLEKHKQVLKTDHHKKVKDNDFIQLKRTAFLTPIFNNKKINNFKMKQQTSHTTEKMTPKTSRVASTSTKEFYAPEISTFAKVIDGPEIYEKIATEKYSRSNIPQNNPKQNIFIITSKNGKKPFNEETEDPPKPHVKLKQRVFVVKPKMKPNQNENFENRNKFIVHDADNYPDSENDKYSGKNSLKHFEEVVLNEEAKNKKYQNEDVWRNSPAQNIQNKHNRIEFPENEIINYIQEMINNRRTNLMNSNKNKVQHLDKMKNNHFENSNTKETNKKLVPEDEHTTFPENTEDSNHKPKSKIYVAHTKNHGRQHHVIYFEPEKVKTKTKKTHSKNEFNRNPREDNSNRETTETQNKYEKFLERLKNKDIFHEDEVTTNKIKHQTEIDTEDDTIDETPETFTEPEATVEENPEIEELYSEIPVNKKRIQLSLSCDSADYINKDHCICSVQTMLRDLMDDLKDINSSMNYQYDCSKYIGIQPGIVIANDSRRLVLRDRRDIFFKNFLLRRGSRIGRDVDSLLNDNLNVDNLDNSIFATVGSKVVLHCGNSSEDYNDEDKIVWTVHNGAPETAGFKEDNGRELIIERVSAQDTNNYTCAISHKLEDGKFGPTKKFLHKLSIVEFPIYSLMITVILNESAKCEQEDLETLHNYYPAMLNKFLCHGAEQICSISVDKPHCTKSHSENGVTMHATLKTVPLYSILPMLRKKQQVCGISCQSRIYSIIVKTLQNNFASVANLPGIIKSIRNFCRYSMTLGISPTCFPIPF